MGAGEHLEFDDRDRQRIYEYVERHGAVAPEQVRDDVRVEAPASRSKPARSGTGATSRVRMKPAEFRRHVSILERDGLLEEVEGKLRVALPAGAAETVETVETARGDVTIRPARQEDHEGVVAAIQGVTAERTHILAESVAELLEHEDALLRQNPVESRLFFVATVDDDDVVGWLHIRSPEFEKLRHTAELTLGVVEEYRRQGVGSRLMERGLEWAEAEDYHKVYQSLPATNAEAVEFLEHNGWEVEAVREDHYLIDGEFVDEVMMAIRL